MFRFSTILLLIFLSCSSNQRIRNTNIDIVIEHAQSYRYDLKNQILTVFHIMRPDTSINFQLTAEEKKFIVDKYYELNLNEIIGNVRIEDRCMSMPKTYTVLKMHTEDLSQRIVIDEGCSDYKSSEGKRTASFLPFLNRILHSKPEIGKNLNSDIFYLYKITAQPDSKDDEVA